MKTSGLLAVVRVRGLVNVRGTIGDTMDVLRLYHKNYCVLVYASESTVGMVSKVQDYVTFGEIDEPTLIELLKQRGRITANNKLTEEYLKKVGGTSIKELAKELLAGTKRLKDIAGLKPFFRLSPPKKGFERGGIKHPYSTGGALGYRKEKINELIMRML